ncbi:MAG: chorismate mutase [Chloroflexi bacterium]|nr:chorismate mutase [Chloroflexota bacterium]
MAKIRGIRGATIADDNTQESILDATVELLTALVESNEVDVDDIAAAYFTTTEDLNAEFPAAAARQLGWQYVALLCAHEMQVPNAMGRVIRVMLLVNTDREASEIEFQYLRGADALRNRVVKS